jgi:hypothetical protein
MRLKLKFWGSKNAVESFIQHLDQTFLASCSSAQNSSQGDYHAFATIEILEENRKK